MVGALVVMVILGGLVVYALVTLATHRYGPIAGGLVGITLALIGLVAIGVSLTRTVRGPRA
jgi:hypothetical protein